MNGEGKLRTKLVRIGDPSYDWNGFDGQVSPIPGTRNPSFLKNILSQSKGILPAGHFRHTRTYPRL